MTLHQLYVALHQLHRELHQLHITLHQLVCVSCFALVHQVAWTCGLGHIVDGGTTSEHNKYEFESQ